MTSTKFSAQFQELYSYYQVLHCGFCRTISAVCPDDPISLSINKQLILSKLIITASFLLYILKQKTSLLNIFLTGSFLIRPQKSWPFTLEVVRTSVYILNYILPKTRSKFHNKIEIFFLNIFPIDEIFTPISSLL